ncbi:Alpha/Beta hydrolase protein [Tricladium varicosporioides]|nr:Alpha/Beta hydrolase protein [Hymenoscyphus varicosporioides]
MCAQYLLIFAYLLFSSLCLALPSEYHKHSPTCRKVTFSITASGKNLDLSAWSSQILLSTPISSLFGDGSTLNFQFPVNGTFNIVGIYCEPLKSSSRGNVIQVLVHGSSYTKTYWNGNNGKSANHWADKNNWVIYAINHNYATLAIDRLGCGESAHPEPKAIVQYSFEVEVMHNLIQQLRSNRSLLGTKFNKVIYAGHALGSIIGDNLVSRYPNDVDALVLTSYSSTYNTKVFGDGPIDQFVGSAATVLPDRFASYDPGYTVFLTNNTLAQLFYFPGAYDPDILATNFNNRDAIAIGEIATAAFGPTSAPQFKGPVLVATAQHDLIFCGTGPLGSSLECGDANTGFVAATKSQFPAAKSFEAYVLPNSGSAWLDHNVASEGIKHVHDWLDRVGFR